VQLRFPGLDLDAELEEFRLLVQSAGADACAVLTGKRERPDVATFLGKGKAEELRELVTSAQIDVVIVNHDLSPAQERNLEKIVSCRVLDRSGLILDIFAQRARSMKASCRSNSPSSNICPRAWCAAGLTWSASVAASACAVRARPSSRRPAPDPRARQASHSAPREVRAQRHSRRKARHKIPIPTVSLVGYTNAGKSTLFNRLTGAGVYVADQLFATLDPTMRRVSLTGNAEVILADNGGFHSPLPHHLVEAFKSTLEEVAERICCCMW